MVATRSGTSAVGINLPPVHGAQKAIDPTLIPENQSKSQKILAKPALITSGRKVINPAVRWTPAQTPPKSWLKSPFSSTNKPPQKFAKYPSTFANSHYD